MRVPPSLRSLGASSEGQAWLQALPRLLDAAIRRWSLRVEAPFAYACASLAMPALTADGTDAVLKLAFPHRESEHEAEALTRWAGAGAVRLLDHHRESGALLLERCRPGTPLDELPAAAALDVIVDLLPRLCVLVGPPFRALSEEAVWWGSYLERRWEATGRRLPRALVDAALEALEALPSTQGEAVLVNQDLHAGNVLRAERQPWLVIDPKPLAGEREFAVASVVRDPSLGHSRTLVHDRLDRLCRDLGLDRERARRWALAQTVAWSFEGTGVLASHVDVASWLAEAG